MYERAGDMLREMGWEEVARERELSDTTAGQPSGAGVRGSRRVSVGSSDSARVL
jgi:hypothetical protein